MRLLELPGERYLVRGQKGTSSPTGPRPPSIVRSGAIALPATHVATASYENPYLTAVTRELGSKPSNNPHRGVPTSNKVCLIASGAWRSRRADRGTRSGGLLPTPHRERVRQSPWPSIAPKGARETRGAAARARAPRAAAAAGGRESATRSRRASGPRRSRPGGVNARN